MNDRYAQLTALAATQHAAASIRQLDQIGVDRFLRREWSNRGLIRRSGPHSYVIVGSEPTWQQSLWTAVADARDRGFVAGRSGARLLGLDGFVEGRVEMLAERADRNLRTVHRLATTEMSIQRRDTIVIDGIRCLNAERLILDAPLFGFDRGEIERAIDSAIRLRLVSEQRLRTRVIARHRRGINHGRLLLDALVDMGGESRLERWFLRIVRQAGLPRPELQKVFRSGQRVVARVDALFGGDLIVEIAGHGPHGNRVQVQRDEQRRTELVLRGFRVITFTYDDVRYRPDWVVARLQEALRLAA